MRKISLILAFLPSAAFAFGEPPQPPSEPSKPTVEEITVQANSLIAALQTQRNGCNDQAAQLAAKVDALTKELAAKKPPVEPKK